MGTQPESPFAQPEVLAVRALGLFELDLERLERSLEPIELGELGKDSRSDGPGALRRVGRPGSSAPGPK